MSKINVILPTLESHNHIDGDIERGVKIYNENNIEFKECGPDCFSSFVPANSRYRNVSITFSRDGRDIKQYQCDCASRFKNPPVCRHVVAAILAIQGGVINTKLALGMTATATTTVTTGNVAKALWDKGLDVFSTPMMIALMELAAGECLANALEPGETSVGAGVNILHTASSPIGAEITATATVDSILGRRVEFTVVAENSSGEIGRGKHTRVIIDPERFMVKNNSRGEM